MCFQKYCQKGSDCNINVYRTNNKKNQMTRINHVLQRIVTKI